LRDLRDHGPSEDELRVAKEHLKGSLMLSLESTASRMSNLARQEFYFGRQLTLEETLAGVEGVRCDQVHDVARELFENRRLAVSAVGRVGRVRFGEEDLRL
jgi:predicted Zn-dependent peptidase